jgi:hypothetical protein
MDPLRPAAALLMLSFAVAASTAHAQMTAPATPMVTPAPNCEKPGDPPSSGSSEIGKSAAEAKRAKWSTDMKDYLDCLKKFVEQEQQASSTHARAANAAVEEYNRAIKAYNEQIAAQRQ